MANVWRRARLLVCLLISTCGCGREALGAEGACDALLPGDLVITEIHANPKGADGSQEYVELFNASGTVLALDGVTITVSRNDGFGTKTHRLAEASVEAGDYFVAGNAAADSMPDYLDYSYGESLGRLRNSDGVVLVTCDTWVVDRVVYGRTFDGLALQLDGATAPSDIVNDDPSAWCATPREAELEPSDWGTPGAPNRVCDSEPPEGECLDDGAWRPIAYPPSGGVRITEWMANPDGLDGDLEWLELSFFESADLNGIQLGPSPDALELVFDTEECVPVDAGVRIVFGASPAAAPRVDSELGFTLRNSGQHSIVVATDQGVLDRVDYDGTVEGVAWQADPHGELCLSPAEGTPGEPNPNCKPVLGDRMCLDAGIPRKIVRPEPGQARIVEWLADPSAVSNRAGEWIEVRVDAAFDLNGLTLSDLTGDSSVVKSEQCLWVTAGTHVVFAREPDPLKNGGVAEIAGALSLSLNNRDETIVLSVDGEVLDSVTYARSAPGVASQVDALDRICAASDPFGDGDLGTPGTANSLCD